MSRIRVRACPAVKVDRITNLKLFTDISTILFQLAVTAAALNSIGVF